MRPMVIGCFGLWIVGSSGCDVAGGSEALSVVRDSAGISIVENRGSMWRRGEGWRVSDAPEVVIGDRLDDPDYELFQVTDAVRLADGRLAIANAGSKELRFYDATGAHLRNAGGEGGGPGEFEAIRWVAPLGGDSLIVWDGRLRRFSVFDLQGEFGRNATLGDKTYFADYLLSDGTIIAQEAVNMMMTGEMPEYEEGSQRSSVRHGIFSFAGEQIGEVGPFPGDEFWVDIGEHMHRWRRVFGLRTARTVSDSIFWVGTGGSYTLDGYDRSGTLVARIRNLSYEPAPVVAGDVELWVEQTIEEMDPGMADHMRPYFESIPPPEMMPPYDKLLADAEGNLWVERYQRPQESAHVWTVFNAEGRLLGSVEIPGGVTVFEIGSDYVLGRWSDEFDVEQVHLYRLIKS